MASENLPHGLYERLIDVALDERLSELDPDLIQRARLDPVEADVLLARHIARLAYRALRTIGSADPVDVEAKVAAANTIIHQLAAAAPKALDAAGDALTDAEQRVLYAITQASPTPGKPVPPPRPEVPLSQAALLVNGRAQPRIGTELARELESADSVDLLCAFIRWYGIRTLQPQLERLLRRGARLRVLTTTYTGSTERKALDYLARLGADVRISYDTRTTRLHAKAWLFHRRSGFSTAYVGSSNLTKSALLDGMEWNVRLTQPEQPHLLETFQATFEDYWEDVSFELYDPDSDGGRLDEAIAAESRGNYDLPIEVSTIDVAPFPFQAEILEKLDAERLVHDRWKNLVVAATGTGKTVMAGLDYRRLRATGAVDTLLFVAHREEILRQSLNTFRHIMRSGSFGELYVGINRPAEWRHVFASIQSLAQLDLTQLDPSHFSMVIVDEFHHAMAPTYERLLAHVAPTVLLGLTATPERTDQKDVKSWFGGRIAAELRLWEALDRGLLCPFQYFGLHDNVDLSEVTWRRGQGYDTTELSNLLTGHDARARMIAEALREKVGDPGSIRALGFCVSIAHSEFMADRFNRYGISATAISSNTSREDRLNALERLRRREINVIFSVDLFNEGIDVPEIDTVLFLRPTESATVFLQQLGRGLRHYDEKACLTVLDFIGNQHARFRFDLRYRALTGMSRRGLEREVEQGFPYLPAGCHMELDRVAQGIVLSNLRQALNVPWRDLVAELARLGDVSLAEFLHETDLTVEDVYSKRKGGWLGLRRAAGFDDAAPKEHDDQLANAFSRMLHINDLERLRTYTRFANRVDETYSPREQRLRAMFHFAVWGARASLADVDQFHHRLLQDPARCRELTELLTILTERIEHVTRPLDAASMIPLHVHGRYSRDETLAAFGHDKPHVVRQGVVHFPEHNADVFFPTLRKSERHFSPTTMYNDYAISPTLFHWESQSTTGENSNTGRRYQSLREGGGRAHLFIRESKIEAGQLGAPPYLYAGPVEYVSHEGEKPMRVIWRLTHPLPAEFFQAAKVVGG